LIKKILKAGNIIYIAIFVSASVFIAVTEGWHSYLNFLSILAALFLPVLALLNISQFIKNLILKETIEKSKIFTTAVYILLIFAAYFFGMQGKQRTILLILDIIFCFVILLIILYYLFSGKKTKIFSRKNKLKRDTLK
jgi:hypothetical protein